MQNNEDNKYDELDYKKDDNAPELETQKEAEVNNQEEYQQDESVKTFEPKTKRNYTMVAATAVIGIAALGVITSSGLINIDMDANINDISFVDNYLYYDVDVADVKKDNEIYFEVFLDGKSITTYTILNKKAYSGNLNGKINLETLELKEGNEPVQYKFRLKGDTGLIDRTYDSRILEISSVKSEFRDVLVKCDCKNSGYLLMDMDFEDDLHLFNEFNAYLVDSNGTRRDFSLSDNLHETQKVFVSDLCGGQATVYLSYKKGTELINLVLKVNI